MLRSKIGDPLTVNQERFLAILKAFIAENGYSPSHHDLRKLAGFSSTRSVAQNLDALEAKGYIVREKNIARSIRVTEPSQEKKSA